MSVTTATTTPTVTEPEAPITRPGRPLWRTTVGVGVVAAAVTTALAAVAHATGVSFEVDGELIPLLGFAQMTFLGAVLGGLILAALNRWSRAAQRRFVQTAVALTVLSCIPSVLVPDDTATTFTLVALHLLAAVIIVPVLARHAHD